MIKPLYRQRLTNKEKFDQRTMLYFYPKSGWKAQVSHNDHVKMALLSSRGVQPNNRTKGFLKLLWGKTYRDLQITQWKDDIQEGYITKYEIYSGLPAWMQPWAQSKLRNVPYDIKNNMTPLLLEAFRSDTIK